MKIIEVICGLVAAAGWVWFFHRLFFGEWIDKPLSYRRPW